MDKKQEYELKILEYRPWIKRLKTPYINVRTNITVECQNGHCIECKDVRSLINAISDKNKYYQECPICNSKKPEFEKLKPKCIHCGKELTYSQFVDGQRFCSRSCSATVSNKLRSTNDSLERFNKLTDNELKEKYQNCTSFTAFCNKNNFINLSADTKKYMKEKLIKLGIDIKKSNKIITENTNFRKLEIHSRALGELGELELQRLAIKLGITVLKPLIDMEPYDLVLLKNDKLVKFQVKTTQSNVNESSSKFHLRRVQLQGNKFKEISYNKNDFDYFFLADITTGKNFIIKFSDAPKDVIHIHKEEFTSYIQTTMNLEKDLDAEKILKEIFNIT